MEITSTLGVVWDPLRDHVVCSIEINNLNERVTKRTILSCIAKLFDPLDLLGPVIVNAKIIMQQLWLNGVEWDDSVPIEIYTSWIALRDQLSLLNGLRIPRRIIMGDYMNLQLNGFCDASERSV